MNEGSLAVRTRPALFKRSGLVLAIDFKHRLAASNARRYLTFLHADVVNGAAKTWIVGAQRLIELASTIRANRKAESKARVRQAIEPRLVRIFFSLVHTTLTAVLPTKTVGRSCRYRTRWPCTRKPPLLRGGATQSSPPSASGGTVGKSCAAGSVFPNCCGWGPG